MRSSASCSSGRARSTRRASLCGGLRSRGAGHFRRRMMAIAAAISIRSQRLDLGGKCGIGQTWADALGDIESGGPARHVADAAVGQFHMNSFSHDIRTYQALKGRTFRCAVKAAHLANREMASANERSGDVAQSSSVSERRSEGNDEPGRCLAAGRSYRDVRWRRARTSSTIDPDERDGAGRWRPREWRRVCRRSTYRRCYLS